MFLDVLRRRNPRLIEQAIALHQAGKIPANSYVIDLDTVEANARAIRQAADRLHLKVFAMTKQMSRSPSFCKAVARGGITSAVAVDMDRQFTGFPLRRRDIRDARGATGSARHSCIQRKCVDDE